MAAEEKHGVNARFLLAAAMHESGWGTSSISRIKKNLFGYNAYDRDPGRYASAFRGYASGIDAVAKFMKRAYLTPGGRWWSGRPTLRAMQRYWSSSGILGRAREPDRKLDPARDAARPLDQVLRPRGP